MLSHPALVSFLKLLTMRTISLLKNWFEICNYIIFPLFVGDIQTLVNQIMKNQYHGQHWQKFIISITNLWVFFFVYLQLYCHWTETLNGSSVVALSKAALITSYMSSCYFHVCCLTFLVIFFSAVLISIIYLFIHLSIYLSIHSCIYLLIN